MTQHNQASPTRDSIVFHANSGCDIRHKTNATLDRCESEMDCERCEKLASIKSEEVRALIDASLSTGEMPHTC